jgi:protein-disulfide isomerase
VKLKILVPAALAVAFAFAGCKSPDPQHAQAKPTTGASATTGLRLNADQVVAKWTGGQVTYGELVQKRAASFKKQQNKCSKELSELEHRELEGFVIQNLVQSAAAKAGKSEDDYLKSLAGSPVVSEQDARDFYDKNLKSSGQPFEAIQDKVRQYLASQKQQETVRGEFERLKKEAGVVIDLPAPETAVASFDLEGRAMKGNPQAKVTIVEFSDFQCPYCSQAVHGVEEIMKAYPNDVKFYFLNFPLSFHQNALPAAIAAQCANKEGKFWQFHDKLFQNQQQLNPAFYDSLATEFGLDPAKWKACLADPQVKAHISADQEQGESAGVEGTPSFYINGVAYAGGVPTPDAVKSYVDKAK